MCKMSLVEKNELDKKTIDDSNVSNEEKDDAPLVNSIVEELECNNENAPCANVATKNHISNRIDASSLDRYQSISIDNNKHTYLLDNRIDYIKRKTCLPNKPFMKTVHSVNKNMFGLKK